MSSIVVQCTSLNIAGSIESTTVNREILAMVLFWPILAPKYEVPKLNTPKYVTLQKLTAKIEHCLNIFLYLYSLICTFLSYGTSFISKTLSITLYMYIYTHTSQT